jgi:MFS family permease
MSMAATSVDPPATRLGGNYWKLFSASTVANLGDGLMAVAIPWLASAITRDPLQIALVALATRVPWLLFSLPAGVITDRFDRRRLVAMMDVARCVAIFAFAAVVMVNQGNLSSPEAIADGSADPPGNAFVLLALLYVTALLVGFAEVLHDNSAQTLLPSIVGKHQLERANSRMWGAEMTMNQFVGPPLAGLLLGVAFALPFFVNAGAFAVAAALVFALTGAFAPKGQTTSGRIDWRGEIGEGLRWLWRHELLRSLAIILGGLNAMGAMSMAIYVLFAQEVLALDARGFGLLLTGSAVGAVLGSLLADRLSARIGPGRSLFTSMIGMGIGVGAIGLLSHGTVVWAILATSGFLVVLWNVITVSLRQSIIPDHLLGRVNSVYRFFGWGTISLGSLLGGIIVTIGEPMLGREGALRMPFLIAAAVAWIIGGNLVASAIGTAVGNPITFPFIWGATLEVGKLILYGRQPSSIGPRDIGHLLWNLDFSRLWEPFLKPMAVGSLPLGIAAGLIFYVLARWATRTFRDQRRKRLAERARRRASAQARDPRTERRDPHAHAHEPPHQRTGDGQDLHLQRAARSAVGPLEIRFAPAQHYVREHHQCVRDRGAEDGDVEQPGAVARDRKYKADDAGDNQGNPRRPPAAGDRE